MRRKAAAHARGGLRFAHALIVPALIVAALAAVGVAGTLAGRHNDRDAVWIGLVQDAQRGIDNSHLRLEELLAGDRRPRLENDVINPLRMTEQICRALRDGGRIGVGHSLAKRHLKLAAALRDTVVVQVSFKPTYTCSMDVAISTLRAELSSWIGRARAGEEIVVTDRGTPVARLLAIDTAPPLDQLVERGVLSKPPRTDRPSAQGASRVHASGPVADLVSEQRR